MELGAEQEAYQDDIAFNSLQYIIKENKFK